MAINFQNPFLLLLIPIAFGIIFYFHDGLKNMNKGRKRAILFVRSVIFILIILSLSGIHIKTYVDDITTIFAVDLSESSVENQKNFKSFIIEALKHKSKKDNVGIISFGRKSEVEIPIADNIKNIEFQTNPGKDFTNIENALKISRSIIPDDTMKRIVLLTDGEENIGSSIKESSYFKENKIDLKVLKVNKSILDEVQLSSVEIPKGLYENQSFDIKLNIWSNVATMSKINLYSGREMVGEKEVSIEKGENHFAFKDYAKGSGFKPYKVVISPNNDTIIKNNTYEAYTEIKGTPKILLIDGEGNGAREINKILENTNLEVTYIKDRQAPSSLSELLKYNTVVMCDVSLENVSSDYINSLKVFVRDYGGGLLVTGGENSFALGGYYKTPLEEILPVDMEMKVKGKVPNLGLMLVIDKSGSMTDGQYGLSKIDIAKEASIKAINSLKHKDKIGVIAFDDSVQTVVPLEFVNNEDDIKSSIGTIRSGGGTSIIPALDEAYKALKKADTKLKHIILLTDGQAERSGYDKIIEDMNKAGITISTLAVGDGADTTLLEGIAESGLGRYYFVDEFSTIPQIFTKETFLASKAYINNRTFKPQIRAFHEIVNSLGKEILEVDGYIGTSNKDRAEVILVSDQEDPILSTWQYGLGKSIAWTSDVNGKWTKNYLNTKKGIDFFKNMIEYTFPKISNNNLLVESNVVGEKGEILVKELGEFKEGYLTKASIITPSLKKIDLELKPSKPGEYEGKFHILEKGVYFIQVNQYKEDTIINIARDGIVINYSKEYDFRDRKNHLNNLINKTDGKIIENPEEVFTNYLEPVYGSKDLSRFLLIIALLLFIIDIGLRRFNVNFRKYDIIKEKMIKNKSKEIRKVEIPSDNINKENLKNQNEKAELKEIEINKDEEKNINIARLLKAKDKTKRF